MPSKLAASSKPDKSPLLPPWKGSKLDEYLKGRPFSDRKAGLLAIAYESPKFSPPFRGPLGCRRLLIGATIMLAQVTGPGNQFLCLGYAFGFGKRPRQIRQ